MEDLADRRRLLRDAVVAYLVKHPAASDTAEGICRWWLRPSGYEDDVTIVEGALVELVGARKMQRRELPDGGVVYFASRGSGE